jgi:hypothetical protein
MVKPAFAISQKRAGFFVLESAKKMRRVAPRSFDVAQDDKVVVFRIIRLTSSVASRQLPQLGKPSCGALHLDSSATLRMTR